jgi:hypothetical protein
MKILMGPGFHSVFIKAEDSQGYYLVDDKEFA